MKKLFCILSVFLAFIVVFAFADFHSSITKIDYNEGNKVLEFTTKINVNDLSKSVNINIDDPNFEVAVKRYVSDNFFVFVNDFPVILSFSDCKVNGQTIWIYFESDKIGDISSIKVKNTILLNEFSNQKNLIIVSYKGNQKTFNLQRGKEIGEANF